MKIKNSPFCPDGNANFNLSHKGLAYNVNIGFFPFKGGLSPELILESELEDLCIPIARVEFKVLDIETSIYRSDFLMPHNALYIVEEMPGASINQWAEKMAVEIGYVKRIEDYLVSREKAAQLSLF